MSARTDFAVIGTDRVAQRMGVRLSAPAERVEVEHDLTTMRFSRSLDERAPHVRSSQAQFVEQLDHEFDVASLVIYLIAVALVVTFAVGSLQ